MSQLSVGGVRFFSCKRAHRLLKTSSPRSYLLWTDLWQYWWAVPACLKPRRRVNAKLDQLMCSRAAWKELEALSNQEGSSDCYPFNYVVWVSTVVIAKAGWGHAGGGLCSRSLCAYVRAHQCVTVGFSGALRECASARLQCLFVLLESVCESEQLQMCNMFKCVYSLFVVHQSLFGLCDSFIFQVWAIWNMFVYLATESRNLLSGFMCLSHD